MEEEVSRAVNLVLESGVDAHVIIIDNTPDPINLPNYSRDRVSVVQLRKNVGYGKGHNIAIEKSAGLCRYHLVANTDISFDKTVLTALIDFMDSHPCAGLVLPKTFYTDGRLQRLCRLLPNPVDMVARRFFKFSKWGKTKSNAYELGNWGYDTVANIPYLSGCFMLMRRTVLTSVGGFDERFFLYGEDIDLSRRIHQVSETLYNPDVNITHFYRGEIERDLVKSLRLMKGMFVYFQKWGWIFDRERDRINKDTLKRLGLLAGQSRLV